MNSIYNLVGLSILKKIEFCKHLILLSEVSVERHCGQILKMPLSEVKKTKLIATNVLFFPDRLSYERNKKFKVNKKPLLKKTYLI